MRRCGTCVARNAINETQEHGDCPYTGKQRHRDDPACENWFGLEQLRAPNYGKTQPPKRVARRREESAPAVFPLRPVSDGQGTTPDLPPERVRGDHGQAKIGKSDRRRSRRAPADGRKQKRNSLPEGKFACILADPPWRFETWSPKGCDRCPDATPAQRRQNNPERHYATMALSDIKRLPVAERAAKDCVLLMWVVDSMIPQAIEVAEAWGFKFKTVAFYWCKLRRQGSTRDLLHDEPDHKLFPMGTGYWTRPNPEQCLLFTTGKPKRISAAVRKLIISRRREHSRKPDEQYERIEALVRGPYLELFGRTERPGWTVWGNDVQKFNPKVAIKNPHLKERATPNRRRRFANTVVDLEEWLAANPNTDTAPTPIAPRCFKYARAPLTSNGGGYAFA